jgi:hypoxanthine phosphoribosyltransferase
MAIPTATYTLKGKTADYPVLFAAAAIRDRVRELAGLITDRYLRQGVREITLITVLNGGKIFADDLYAALLALEQLTVHRDALRVSSYNGTRTTGHLTWHQPLAQAPAGRHLLLAEDIIDSGRTMTAVVDALNRTPTGAPASVQVATLLDKRAAHQISFEARFIGFVVEPRFVVGYGLDWDGEGRDFPDIIAID